MGILDYIRKTMHPESPVNEEGKSPIPQRIMPTVDFKFEADNIALAYRKMNEEINTKDKPKPSTPPKAPKAPTGPKSEPGAAAAKQEPVKLGGKTPVDTSPTLEPPKASDTKPEATTKKKKEEVKTEEHLDEVSPKLARSYFNKANDQELRLTQKYNSPLYGGKGPIKDKGEKEKVLRKVMNRRAGIDRAYKKMTKEEVKTEGIIRTIGRAIRHQAAHAVADVAQDALGVSKDFVRDVSRVHHARPVSIERKKADVRARKETDTPAKHTHVQSAGKKKSSNLERFFAHEKAKRERAATHQPEGKPAPEAKAHASKVMSKPKGKYGHAASTQAHSGKTFRPDLKKNDKPASFKVKVRIKALKQKEKSDPGTPIKMDRKDFAKRLKDAGGNLKKVHHEETVVESVRSIISRLKNGKSSDTKKTHFTPQQMEKWQKYHKMSKQALQQGGDK